MALRSGAARSGASIVLDFAIVGMTCASCVGRVERALAVVPGVSHADVNLATNTARVTLVSGQSGAVLSAALKEAVETAGYDATPVLPDTVPSDAVGDHESMILRRDLMIALGASIPLVIIEMGGHMVPAFHDWLGTVISHRSLLYLTFVLASIVQFGPGRRFYIKGVPALLRAAPDMNALVVIGTSAAYLYSVVVMMMPSLLPADTGGVYFETSAVVITLILLGRTLESGSRGRANAAIRGLMALRPATANVQRGGQIITVPLGDIVAGDRLVVRPGETIPVDATVTDGSSYVDEAMLTGEAIPVSKGPGDEVTGGTMNRNGSLIITATRVGSDSVLSQIMRLVASAQGAKLPIQALVDKVTMWFVPAIMAIAAFAFVAWWAFGPDPVLSYALVAAVSVLIVACPCAMGLATPMSIMVGVGRGAELGILFRRGDALQTLGDVKTIAFDKTGTLTQGKPVMSDFVVTQGFAENDILALIAAVEARSEHPVADAIVTAAHARGLSLVEPEQFIAEPGLGVRASVSGRAVVIGAAAFMRQLGVDVNTLRDQATALAEKGRSPVYAAVDGRLAAVVAVSDTLRPSAARTIAALHAKGLHVAMLTGDDARTARIIAAELGITDVAADMRPGGKVEALIRLREMYGPIAFVGDGINDAPALAEADIGIAIGAGSDVAIESADLVLMGSDPAKVATAIALSKSAMSNVKQNLFWAFAYNVVLVPVAAGLLYPLNGMLLSPPLAAGAMALSSLFVVGNALRLRRVEPVA
jgi:heavy metal translocating P-type ATPase